MKAAAPSKRAKAATTNHRASRTFSHEIHGVRGLALTMVVAFHLFGEGRVSGGVDVFLVISAYLITGSMLRAIFAGRLSLVHRYGRTFSRLLPSALLTIVTTLAVSLLVLPKTQLLGTFEEGQAAAIFRENIYLATKGMAYEAAGRDASPFQHFWSLSMQGQFLLLLPLVVFVLIHGLKKLDAKAKRKAFFTVVLVATVLSFACAIRAVSVDQEVAYYSLGARLWEFGLGALAAFFTHAMPRHARFAGWLGWVGVLMILTSGVVTDGSTTFPGPWALWPVVGTLFVLFSADSGGARNVRLTHALSLKPIVWLANRGYPLYLWHWPILVFFLAARNQTQIGYVGALAVLALSFALSEATIRFVSTPFTKWANRTQGTGRGQWKVLGIVLAGALSAALLAHAGVAHQKHWNQQQLDRAQEAVDQAIKEEEALLGEDGGLPPYDPSQDLIPSAAAAPEDLPAIYDMGCVQKARDTMEAAEVLTCPDTPENQTERAKLREDKPRVVLTGGSHAAQFYPALRRLADEEGWELIAVEKNGCRLAVGDKEAFNTESCWLWNQEATNVILALEPDLVVTLGTATDGVLEGPEKAYQHQVDAWKRFTDEGVPVVALRDTPRFPHSIPGCLTVNDEPAECGLEKKHVYESESPLGNFDLPELVTQIDVSHRLCDDDYCPAVIGNIVAYRDRSHLSATFAQTLAPSLKAALLPIFPDFFLSE